MSHRFTEAFHSAADGMLIVDRHGTITYSNQAADRLLSCASDTLVGRNVSEFFSERYCESLFRSPAESQTTEPTAPLSTVETIACPPGDRYISVSLTQSVTSADEEHAFAIVIHDVTEREQLLARVQRSEARLKAILDAANVGVFLIDPDEGQIIEVNPHAASMLQYTPQEMEGMHMSSIHPGEMDRMMALARRVLHHGEGRANELSCTRKDGTSMPAEMSASVVNIDGKQLMLAMVLDMSEMRKVETALRESQANYEHLYDHAPDMFVSVDVETREIVKCNATFADVMGCSKEELVGKPVLDIYHPRSVDAAKKAFAEFLVRGEVFAADLHIQTRAGAQIPVTLRASAVRDAKNNIIESRSVLRDASELEEANAKRLELEEQLQQKQRLETIGTLAGGIAHDFNNILAPILGYADLMRGDGKRSDEENEFLDQIMSAANRGRDLAHQILIFGQKHQRRHQVVKLQDIVVEALNLTRASVPATINIDSRIDSTCKSVWADVTQIHQVVMNLCSNAAQAMPDQSGSINVTLDQVEIDVAQADGATDLRPGTYAVVKVQDTGSGMGDNIKQRIFEPFFTTKTQAKGTGLGLSVVHGIVASHGGAIQVESHPGIGTTFLVYIPITDAVMGAIGNSDNVTLSGGNETILLVDDDPTIIGVEKSILESLTYTIVTASGGTEALHLLDENSDVKLLITDQSMPHMTGIQLARHVRRLHGSLPVIVLSGYGEFAQEESDKACVNKYVSKPVSRRDLADAVRQVLDAVQG